MNPTPMPLSSAPAVGEMIVHTEQLTKRFGTRVAVNALNMEVRRGDVYGLLGPNGAGKSTTLRMLLGLTWPTAGAIWLFGARVDDDATRRATLRRVGSIIEQPAFYPYLTGRENLRGVGVYSGIEDEHTLRVRVEEALFHVGLAPRGNDAYRTYSLGLKQRLGVAAALLTNPELVILDEPTNGLDPAGMVEMRQLIQQLAAKGMTVILSSHLLHEVQQVCTRVAILNEGTVVAQGEVSELLATGRGVVLGFDQPERSMQAVQVLQDAATNGAPWLRGARYVRPEPGAWAPPGGWLLLVEAPFERAAEVAYLLAARGIYPMEMRQREGSLEELFLALTSAAPPTTQSPVPTVSTPQPVATSQPATVPSFAGVPVGVGAQQQSGSPPGVVAPSPVAPHMPIQPQSVTAPLGTAVPQSGGVPQTETTTPSGHWGESAPQVAADQRPFIVEPTTPPDPAPTSTAPVPADLPPSQTTPWQAPLSAPNATPASPVEAPDAAPNKTVPLPTEAPVDSPEPEAVSEPASQPATSPNTPLQRQAEGISPDPNEPTGEPGGDA